MKKILSILLASLLVLSCVAVLASCGGNKNDPTDSASPSNGTAVTGGTIKIGIFEPATGANAAGGKQEVLGIRYAHSLKNTVTVAGKEYKIELVEVDNQTESTTAPSAAQKLVSEGVSVVLGSYGSSAAMAGGEIFKKAGIPAIGCSCTNPGVTSDNEFYFRVCYLDPFQGTVMAKFAKDSGVKKTLVLTELGDDYSTGLGKFFVAAAKENGLEYTENQFPKGNTDFTSFINTAKAENCDAIFAPTSIEAAALIVPQAKDLGYTGKILAGDTWENSAIIDAAKGSTLYVACSTFFDENDTTAADFVNGYKAWLNADSARLTNNGGNDIVAAVSALGYDAYLTAIAALEKAEKVDGKAIRDALASINSADKAVKGVTGDIFFDEIGDAERDTAFIKSVDTVNGAFKFEKKQTIAK